MVKRKTDMEIDEKRVHGTGEAIEIGEMRGRGRGRRRKGNETSWSKEIGPLMITKRTDTEEDIQIYEIQRKSMKGRGKRKDAMRKRGKGTEREGMKRIETKRERRKTRKEGEKHVTENIELRGREGDTKKAEMSWKSMKERKKNAIERESDTKTIIKI